MQISVTPELELQIKEKIDCGNYSSADELICDALHSMLTHEMQFASISNRKANIESDLVFNQLREHIYRGEFRPGEKLPAVERMAGLMAVASASVERALESLAGAGCLEKCPGGYVVSSMGEASPTPFSLVTISGNASLNELLEVRAGLESYGVVLAVERATRRDIDFMKEALAKGAAVSQEKGAARDADIAFHLGIAYATHNVVYIDLIKRFYEQMFDEVAKLHSLLYETPSLLELIEQHHFKILDAIVGRDKEGARRHMLQHIVFLKSFINRREADC